MRRVSGFIVALFIVQAGYSQTPLKAASGAHLIEVGDGWARNSVNTVVFRRNSITSFGDTQYVAYYNQSQHVVLAKRKLGSSDWEVKETSFTGNATDAHRSISIMADGAGYLHLSWDHHNNELHYCRSIAPGSLEMKPAAMTGLKENKVTYPEFYRLPDGDLLFLYRDGASGNGNLMINCYHTATRQWEQVQDGLIDGQGARNAYCQLAIDKAGVIHLSWVWRESSDVASNHDLCYARSSDGGKTWQRSDGKTYQLPITATTAEYAWRIPQKSELINQTSMAADQNGHPFIATYWRSEGSRVPQYQLVWFDGREWRHTQVTHRTHAFSLSGGGTKRIPIARPQVMVEQKGRRFKVLMVYRDEERGSRVTVAVTKSLTKGYWHYHDLTTTSVGDWEPSYDTNLWNRHKKLDLFIQNVEQGDGEGMVDLPPQPVYVLDWTPSW